MHTAWIDTDDLPRDERLDHWNAVLVDAFAPLRATSEHAPDYRARYRKVRLGTTGVYTTFFQPMTIVRTPRLVRQSDPDRYFLNLVQSGTLAITGDTGETVFSAGHFHPNDSATPFRMHLDHGNGPVRVLSTIIPKDRVPLPPAVAARFIGRPVPSTDGIAALLTGLLIQVTTDADRYPPADGPRLEATVADLIAALFAHELENESALEPETRRRTVFLQAQAFIQRHLTEPGLNPAAIAAAHHISPSHLHRLFHDNGTTVSDWIRQQRLEHARRDLAEPALATEPIADIAARWGFPHPAAFSRAFRTAYGMPPSEYRQHALRSP
ncbi:helix-turn-helix domain-containing protein [Marinitenerispora sediminis]|uniref:helix-turn-helix domain-containing protein n=1 Tax=Marinitenerispora sediminis TaxID=1931232 RepID=UPI001314480F|nr:helix-turn-helix domain-containing protein [Marinitenerispora sediminis]